MISLIESIIGVADKALELINMKESRKYVDLMLRIKKEIMEEETKGYDSDDAKIESLQKELKLTLDALQNDIVVALSTRK